MQIFSSVTFFFRVFLGGSLSCFGEGCGGDLHGTKTAEEDGRIEHEQFLPWEGLGFFLGLVNGSDALDAVLA